MGFGKTDHCFVNEILFEKSVELNPTYYGCCNLSFLGRYVRIYGTLLAYGFNGQIIGYP